MDNFTIEIQKTRNNRLLDRKHHELEVFHSGAIGPTKQQLREYLSKKFNASIETVIIQGMHTGFGGGKTTASARIYDSVKSVKRIEQKYMLARHGLGTNEKKGRKQRKERKNKAKKARGKKKTEILNSRK